MESPGVTLYVSSAAALGCYVLCALCALTVTSTTLAPAHYVQALGRSAYETEVSCYFTSDCAFGLHAFDSWKSVNLQCGVKTREDAFPG